LSFKLNLKLIVKNYCFKLRCHSHTKKHHGPALALVDHDTLEAATGCDRTNVTSSAPTPAAAEGSGTMDDVTVPGQKGGQASAAPRWIPREEAAAAAARREPVATATGEDVDPRATVAESGLVTLRVCIHRREGGWAVGSRCLSPHRPTSLVTTVPTG